MAHRHVLSPLSVALSPAQKLRFTLEADLRALSTQPHAPAPLGTPVSTRLEASHGFAVSPKDSKSNSSDCLLEVQPFVLTGLPTEGSMSGTANLSRPRCSVDTQRPGAPNHGTARELRSPQADTAQRVGANTRAMGTGAVRTGGSKEVSKVGLGRPTLQRSKRPNTSIPSPEAMLCQLQGTPHKQ